MAPGVTCVRHAQGYHNLSIANHQMHDPLLTPYGEEQCRNLRKTFPYTDSIDLVVASPIKRTIYTALISFEPVLKNKELKVIALPELQETSDLPCDTGSTPEELAKEFEGKPVDLSLVNPGWNNKRMKWAPTATAIEKRARDARQWLMARPEKNIVVVSHGL
jgi:broad specificity phosphatase PhoE